MRRMQSGLTMLGFLITLTLVIFFAYCGMKVVPMYIEYYSVQQALKGLAEDTSIDPGDKNEIRKLFQRRLEMSYANYVKGLNALRFEKDKSGVKLVVDYERRESFIANLDVVGKFHAERVISRGAAAP